LPSAQAVPTNGAVSSCGGGACGSSGATWTPPSDPSFDPGALRCGGARCASGYDPSEYKYDFGRERMFAAGCVLVVAGACAVMIPGPHWAAIALVGGGMYMVTRPTPNEAVWSIPMVVPSFGALDAALASTRMSLELFAASEGYYGVEWAARSPIPAFMESPPLASEAWAYSMNRQMAEDGFSLALGRYPGNVEYVKATPGSYTLDRLWGWSEAYNDAAIEGFYHGGGTFTFTSPDFAGTYRREAAQVLEFGAKYQWSSTFW
jgi:hypothetical protein